MTLAAYRCALCGREVPADRPLWRCACGGHLNLSPGRGMARAEIAGSEASLWRYGAALALAGPPRVSLGEGWTPLVARDWAGTSVYFKLESQMPTGSFKDRGTAVMLNHLLEVGVGAIHEDSSGNAGASMATYAAAAGIPCCIYVPAAAPRGKLVQIAAAGAKIRAVAGSRQAVAEAALAAAGESFYASHNWQPYFIEGTKTLAYELWDQLGCRAPDNILVPTGYGSNILGLDRGFEELERHREIARRPRLFAVQAANCAAIAASWVAGRESFVEFAAEPTIADGIATPRPVRVVEVIRALKRSQGGVVAVAEGEIMPALSALGRLGLFVEPTAATAGAALTRLLSDGTIAAAELTVAVLTGSGLKAAERLGEFFGIG
ncbi:MAG TPA: pyridoxal-phosphate dependent enzyme [Stellaceae bacterium]|nr:pyridoxal-phosphate dependent enzyme [Stellaceae bacterium]